MSVQAMAVNGIIFDMDGVIVSTDKHHYQSWALLAKDHGIYFDQTINDRLRGLSRNECIEIFIENESRSYSESEKERMASKKNSYYLDLLKDLSSKDILPGVSRLLNEIKDQDLKVAIGTSSKNCSIILEKIGLSKIFKIFVDGNQVSHGKPNPEIFLTVADRLKLPPNECVVIEDGPPGVEAALRAGMKVLGVGQAVTGGPATSCVSRLTSVTLEHLLTL